MWMKNITFLMVATIFYLLTTEIESKSAISRADGIPCDENGLCKFGGRCGPRNTCVCNFNCPTSSWETAIYCGTKGAGGRRHYYLNLCQLLAHACEQQRDIPIIKMDFKKPPSKRCNDRKKPVYKLCKNAEDFMGPCGATVGLTGSAGAGICLQDAKLHSTFCQCPKNRIGRNCEAKVFHTRSLSNYDIKKYEPMESEKNQTDFLIKVAIFSVFGAITFIVCSALFLKKLRGKSTCGTLDDDVKTTVSSSEKDCYVAETQQQHAITLDYIKEIDDVKSNQTIKDQSCAKFEKSTEPQRPRLHGQTAIVTSIEKSVCYHQHLPAMISEAEKNGSEKSDHNKNNCDVKAMQT